MPCLVHQLLFVLLLGLILSYAVSALSLRRNLQMNKVVCKSLVICGPSGVGKGTLIGRLLAEHPTKFGLSVSHTSRKPRPGEVDGAHYHFVDKEHILHDIKHGDIKYIEHAEVHSNVYGTRSDAVAKVHDEGKVCLLDVDHKGVMQIKQSGLPAMYLFIAPVSMEVLAERLRGRGTETEAQVALRLQNAVGEMTYGLQDGNFDAVLKNDDIDEAYGRLLVLLRQWFPFANL